MIDIDQLQHDLDALIIAIPKMMDYVVWGTTGTDEEPERFQQAMATTTPEETHLWDAVMVMHDYGIRGVDTRVEDLDLRTIADFLLGLQALNPVLAEVYDAVPASVLEVVQIASARRVLDGSSRLVPSEPGIGQDVLTLPEVALLAGLDVRTVRNVVQLAGSPKARPDGLVAVHQGKRTVVPVDNARAWLSRRPGFQQLHDTPPEERLDIDPQTLQALMQTCRREGVTPEEWLRRQLAQGART